MTEEEKKVVEYFKKSFTSKTPPYWYDDTIENSEIKIKTLVNLIEKLKKENEELKEKNFKRDKELIKLEEYANKNFERKDDVKAKYIPKDKIREKLEKLENQKENYKEQPLIYMLLKNQLKSLIEEKQ